MILLSSDVFAKIFLSKAFAKFSFLKKYVFKEKSKMPGRLAGGERREAAEQAAGYGLPATGEGRAGGQGSVVSDHPSSISEPPSTESVRHERPKRFVYGEDSKK